MEEKKNGRGGARAGAGRKPGISLKPPEEIRKNRGFLASDLEWEVIKNNAKKINKRTGDYIREKAMEEDK